MMRIKQKLKLLDASDLKVGDMVVYNNAVGMVSKKGRTWLHDHPYVEIKITVHDALEVYTYTDKVHVDRLNTLKTVVIK